jgi:hypothetical protein
MKTLLRFLLVSLAGSVLLTSCSTTSNLALTKRHYRNGYYVDRGHTNPNAGTPAEAYKQEEKVASEKPADVKTPAVNSTPENTTVETTPAAGKNLASRVKEVLKKQTVKTAPAKSEVVSAKTLAMQPASAEKHNQASVQDRLLSEKALLHSDSGHHGFLWTLIVVLLLVWLILFLLGTTLGGLIWLILVVALVIFLLRILGILN